MTYRESGCRPLRYRRGGGVFWGAYLAQRVLAYQYAMAAHTL
jgi:hypothetical protein